MNYHLLLTECFNDRVNVTYDGESSTITCTFYDPQNITGKSCVIDYRICNSQLMGQSLEASSTPESPNIVTLKLQSIDSNQLYCYNVTASNISYTVIVMGRILGELMRKRVIIVIIQCHLVVSHENCRYGWWQLQKCINHCCCCRHSDCCGHCSSFDSHLCNHFPTKT